MPRSRAPEIYYKLLSAIRAAYRDEAWHGELRCPVAISVHGSWPVVGVVVVVGRDVADVDVDDCGYADANVVPTHLLLRQHRLRPVALLMWRCN